MPDLIQRMCAVCASPFAAPTDRAVYCSERCISRAKRRRRVGEPIEDLPQPDATCVVCGDAFAPRSGKLTCSDPCSQRRRLRLREGRPVRDAEQGKKRQPSYSGTCELCGTPFVAQRSWARFCSVRCSRGFVKRHRTLDEWLSLVDRSSSGCHRWPGDAPLSSHGYAISKSHEFEGEQYVHRILWMRRHGPIPQGWEPDHTCRDKTCVREAHHELVPHGENMRRAVPYRRAQKERVGKCLHPDIDVYWDPTGKRVCRICRRERTKMWRDEQPHPREAQTAKEAS